MKEKQNRRAAVSPALVAEAKAGDQAAFAELYRQTNAELYRTVRSMVWDEDQTWDVLQDSYLRAWRGLDGLEAPEAFLPWLRRIAANTAATALAKKRPLTFTDLAVDEDEGEPELPDLSPENHPELALDRKETSRLVQEILAELPEEQQLIVGMRYYEDMPVRDIAETLGVAPGTVKAQLYKGRKKIEAGVRALEKQGVKLYGLSPLPFLLALLGRLEPAAQAEQKALSAVLAAAPAASGTTAGVSGAAAVNLTAMTAGQAFLHGLGAKLLAGGLAIAILIGGGKLAHDAMKRNDEPPVGPVLPSITETAGPDESDPIPTDSQQLLPDETAESLATTEVPVTTEATEPTEPAQPIDSAYACGEALTWRFDADTGVLTIEGSGAMYDYEAGDAPWQEHLEAITALRLPKGLTYIGETAFYGCESLTAVTIPAGVTAIGKSAFADCHNLVTAELPEGLTELGNGVFSNDWDLTYVSFPASLTSIGARAFWDSSITEATIPESAVSVGANAFQHCYNLRCVEIRSRTVSLEETPFDDCQNLVIYGYPDSTASAYAEEWSIPFRPLEAVAEHWTDLSFLSETDLDWEAQAIRNERWIGRALSLCPDGSLYYREGNLFSEYALYLDGLWQAEETGTLLLTLWESPYSAWDRPDDYRVTAADVPADSWTVRFSCTPEEDGLTLRQITEPGFAADDPAGTRIEFRTTEQDLPTITKEELKAFEALDDEEFARLQEGGQDGWDLFGYGGWTEFRGIARAGSLYAAKVEYTVPLTISKEELAQAAQAGRITLQGQEYVYTTSPEEAEQYGYSFLNDDGMLLKIRENGQVGGGGYWVMRAGDRYYFIYEIGGVSSRLETVVGTYWLWLDPDTPLTIGPGYSEDAPKTLGERGCVYPSAICYPIWDSDTGELTVYVDTR